MKIRHAEFAGSAVRADQYPVGVLPEIVLAGRSNVGKSSLINALTGKKGLAKISQTPGKTRTINFYRINDAFYLVDLPGYGYAKVPEKERRGWKRIVEEYFNSRKKALSAALLILDSRRDPGELEKSFLTWIDGIGVPAAVIFTKCDKLSKNQLSERVSAVKRELKTGEILLFSAVRGEGRAVLLKKLDEMLR
ncbi:MAG TPA: ribosome biogenesis GTP-binding protein YihA/YsxC [Thermodesulfobacteriota bacterium]|nr:ribosome biogenesis GTP-binding protein YihA/YsxC [Thermodesulfobacteriota bacterium]